MTNREYSTAGFPAVGKVLLRVRQVVSLLRLSSFDDSTTEGRSKERYRRVALASVTAALARGVGILTGLVTVPLTVRYLGMERYGLWMTASSAIGLLAFADLGMGNGLLNVISEADGKDDCEAAKIYVSSAFFILLGIGILLLGFFALAYVFIPWPRVFNVGSELAARESGPAVIVFIATLAVNMPLGIVQRIQMGYQEGYISHLWGIAGNILALGGLLLAIHFRAGLPWLILAISGGPTLATFLNWVVLFGKSRPWLYPRVASFDWTASRKLLGTGFLFLILQVFSLIGSSSDNLVIAQILGASAVSSYAVTQKLFTITMISQFFIAPLWPAFGEAFARSDFAWARRTLNRSLFVSISVGTAIALPLLLFGKRIIAVWVGPEMVPTTFLLVGFTLWVLLACYGGTMSTFLNHGAMLRQQVIFYGVASVASIVLKIVLTHFWQASGAIWGTVLGYGVFYTVPAARLAYRNLQVPR